ncbi:MAG: acyl-CoA dehydrogenase family protein [Alphaproteobacteria bacterium]|jgi:acyl-CoA dehydrogenase|nr:acyl-CoA dehydrogenase [Rhodospirillaceae bacterium]MDP6020402.1 acyl-CoA dehydrogenase family protein [Alphaproteobacteria bacterium]MDP6254089.1 acyl-CoA dehydrogenase family protein [Alphaproteobacteria bacterium]MDP7052772.1 acyl-CoA dehydrogenase family protein [Alphaproteobacteria bacterium]MDP7229890.1 acyl-CoA dehydrogenase family protein [Alphaproteobacteria bacterium]|tara:strand:- start:10186 stop:11442 length:1257 start_codon:yes stop_codon:yes gene_type:complete
MNSGVTSADGMGYMTEERILIRDSARDFTMKEVLPVANELDPVQGMIPMELRDKMAELGYFGITTPEELGGMGLGCFEYCLIAEQLARGWMSVASIMARGNGSFLRRGIMRGKEDELPEEQRDMIRRAVKGEFLAAAALSEPGTGSDLASISCRAVMSGNEWVINGSKYWCTFADGADYIMLFARTSPPPSADKRFLGISAFVLPKPRGELPNNCEGSPIPKIGYFGWNTYELSFQGTRAPASALVGEEGKAFYMLASGLEAARAHTAARSIGLAQGALEDSIAYAEDRGQFGVPITEFQAIRFKIATMATKIEAARQLLYYVCNEIDQGRRCDKEASMVKFFASEMAEEVTSEAIQIHGGAGYTKLHAVERYWRDARLTKIFEGTSEIQQRIISDVILGKSKSDARMVAAAFAEQYA